MSNSGNQRDSLLPQVTELDIIMIDGEKTSKEIMTLEQWKNYKRDPKIKYLAYQKDFSQFKIPVKK